MVFSSAQDVADALKGKEDLLPKEILAQLGAVASTAAFAKTIAAERVPHPGSTSMHA
ncbi:hypothetical protein OG905_38710 [Streptomyces sp. NBC_00322]|uniref:hypothetical protein n=1 Tax=unclassified Streptomyces TaxID=2593676 RepID=UPI002E287BF9|nr:hypothetical protein [Streptomyces sp. NBC_00322]WSY65069.1 hypothetical protein OHA61_00440 [Streptomyces sp. NBC_00885]